MGDTPSLKDLLQEELRQLDADLAARSDFSDPREKNELIARVNDLMRALLPAFAKEAKQDVPWAGRELNARKQRIEKRHAEDKSKHGLISAQAAPIDVTLPGRAPELGRRHPVYRTMDEIARIFLKLGFDVAYGPEIETERNNFEALNIPLEHPSRDAFDTFYIEPPHLLRSHTSPVQIRTMLERKPPVRIIAPGKVFRPDDADASHLPMFHQVEGLMVGEDVTFAQLKGVLLLFARDMFGADTKVRFRPSFFPFTEPSAEVDISCFLCGAKGCPACKQSGWMEILGSGMVHPRVFEHVRYDPEKYTGFAFGMGVERICMLRHGVSDIRWFLENDFRFLRQF